MARGEMIGAEGIFTDETLDLSPAHRDLLGPLAAACR
jgi:hypothetical protein